MKHVYALYIILLSLTCQTVLAQGQASIWYFGDKAGLDFTSGQPVTLTNGQLNAVEGCSIMSSASGQVMFYTNGLKVWNKFHAVMANGNGLLGDISSSQSSVIVQKPGSANLFYIFTTNAFDAAAGFRYSVVDMSAAGGNGAVTDKNIIISGNTSEQLAVINHTNGQDIWIVTHREGTADFQARLLTASGLDSTVSSTTGCVVTADSDHSGAIGYLKASPDGKKLVISHTFLNKAELFDFDATTGIVSNLRDICTGSHIYGLEFSPDGHLLYASDVDAYKLFQYNLEAPDVAASSVQVGSFTYGPGALQLGPDGKIYLAMAETDKLSVIAYPNRHGSACSVQVNAIDLQGRLSYLGLPNFNQSVFYTDFSANRLCSGDNTQFHFSTPYATQSVDWDFGDNTTATQENPQHHYNAAGDYVVHITAHYPGVVVSRTEDIHISAAPSGVGIGMQEYCAGGVISLSSFDADLLAGQPESGLTVSYYTSMENADDAQNALADVFVLAPGSTTLYARIENAGGCHSVISFTIKVYAQPSGMAPGDLFGCDGFVRDGKAVFNLEDQTPGLTAGGDFSVKYYLSQEDAEAMADPISGAFTNTANPQAIFARVQNEQGCYQIVSFNLIVKQCHDADLDLIPKFLSPNGDGIHDTWSLKGIPGLEDVKVDIFDRYGRLIKQLRVGQQDWDGTFAGVALPADDYWYVISSPSVGEIRGHFALMR